MRSLKIIEHPEYPDGPQTAVSYFTGIIGTMTPNNQIDIYSSELFQLVQDVTRKKISWIRCN